MASDDESRPRDDLGFLGGDDPGMLNKLVRPDVESTNGDIFDDLDGELEVALEHIVLEDCSLFSRTDVLDVGGGGGVKSDDTLLEGHWRDIFIDGGENNEIICCFGDEMPSVPILDGG
mmetsp:Transcript_24457/g.58002  ORF Transcript_24457/g.58002 Transcript_24457/m.58002 type:complete len:118 (+) Transcript_24457:532-885(+)